MAGSWGYRGSKEGLITSRIGEVVRETRFTTVSLLISESVTSHSSSMSSGAPSTVN